MQRPASSPSITSEPKKEEIMGNWDIEEAVFRKKGDGRAQDIKVALSERRNSFNVSEDTYQPPLPVNAPRNLEISSMQNTRCCPVCFEQVPLEKMKAVGSCIHQFCERCIRSYIQECLSTFKRIRCQQQDCQKQWTEEELSIYLSQSQKERFKKLKRHLEIISNPSLKLCKRVDCVGKFDLTIQTYKCDICQVSHCGKCYQLQHLGLCDQKMAKFLEANKKYRQCKRCKQVIQKAQGCTHMTCSCGHYFCYSCGETLQGNHKCQVPNDMNYLQKVRWQIEHLELFYESQCFTFLKTLICLEPDPEAYMLIRVLWTMFFVVLLYPFLILVALIALLIFCTLAVTLFSLFLIILPFIANCNHMDMELNDAVKRCCGPVAGFFIVILFYPIFFVVDFVQFLFIYILCRNLSNILEIVTYLLKGIRNVVLLPCLFFTSNSEYYEAQAQKEAERANRN